MQNVLHFRHSCEASYLGLACRIQKSDTATGADIGQDPDHALMRSITAARITTESTATIKAYSERDTDHEVERYHKREGL
jgi:hypothetical protein